MSNSYYQNLDKNIIDYKIYNFQGLELRGPKLNNQKYVAYIGASQTFGRFCSEPYSHLLEKKLNIGTLNFGVGGKGPTYFLENQIILEAVNQAEIVIIQVLSGRSTGNSVFESLDGGMHGFRLIDGKTMRADEVFSQLISGKDKRGLSKEFMENLVKETRRNYVDNFIELLKAINAPKIFLWLSTRSPQYQEIYGLTQSQKLRKNLSEALEKLSSGKIGLLRRDKEVHINNLLSDFPHLVNREMIEEIEPYSDYYIEYVAKVGLPQILTDFHGKIVGRNSYYPSPQMHKQVSELLYPICESILKKRQNYS